MKKFRKYVKKLRADFPVDSPVRVYLRKSNFVYPGGQREFGFCHFKPDGSIVIHVENTGDEDVAVDSLFHEWAHARIGFTKKRHPIRRYWTEFGRIVNFYTE